MKNGKYFAVDSDEKFTLFLFQPAYYSMKCTEGLYILNKTTGENCGQQVTLCKFVNNLDGTINENPEIEPKDDYEVVLL